jgi:lysophospholipase
MTAPRPACLVPDREDFIDRASIDGTKGRLRYAVWKAPGPPRGSVVLVHGRGEFIEKYAMEVAGELRGRGFAVYAIDIRGQGLSTRMLPDHDKGHIDDFSTYVADLAMLLDTVVAPEAPQPRLLLSHSTGGNIALRYLVAEGSRHFAAAVFSSPMTGLPKGWAIKAAASVIGLLPGADTWYAPSTGPYDPAKNTFETNDVTHDPRRYDFTRQWFAADPRLTLGGPTIGWLRATFRSFDVLNAPGALEAIAIPTLILSGTDDTVVDTATHAKAVARIPGAERVVIDGARHELLMETDLRRAQFWAAFDRLAGKVCPP